MRTLTVTVQNDEAFWSTERGAARRVDRGEGYQGEVHSFPSLRLLFETLTPRRWELIHQLKAVGPTSLRGLARVLGRDVKRVHEDAARLLEEGILERASDGKLHRPFC